MVPNRAIADQTWTIVVGSKLRMFATADGTPPPTFEWFKDGATYSTSDTVVIMEFSQANAGSYYVKASNVAGSANSEVITLVAVPATLARPAVPTNIGVSVERKKS